MYSINPTFSRMLSGRSSRTFRIAINVSSSLISLSWAPSQFTDTQQCLVSLPEINTSTFVRGIRSKARIGPNAAITLLSAVLINVASPLEILMEPGSVALPWIKVSIESSVIGRWDMTSVNVDTILISALLLRMALLSRTWRLPDISSAPFTDNANSLKFSTLVNHCQSSQSIGMSTRFRQWMDERCGNCWTDVGWDMTTFLRLEKTLATCNRFDAIWVVNMEWLISSEVT